METKNLPKTRPEAILSGSKFYFSGDKCVKGHVSARYVSSNSCLVCGRENSKKYARERRGSHPLRDIEAWILNNAKYNAITGSITGVGSEENRNGYVIVKILGKELMAHRVAFFISSGKWPKVIDHINHNKSDNRWCNLREVSSAQNSQNRSLAKNNKTKVNGVSWDKQKGMWRAQICVDRKMMFLKLSHDKWEAICARMSANNKYGFHKNHGRL